LLGDGWTKLAQTWEPLLKLADHHVDITLVDGVSDALMWNRESSDSYSAHSCYAAMFSGRVSMAGALQIWHSRIPTKCMVLLWLAEKNMCWTID
jgi:hypothetical protein